jgi:GTP-binding protein Era
LPQTTRNTVRGIVNRPGGQIVFLDTPGFHISGKKFNLRLREVVSPALADADLVVYLIDATREPGPEGRGDGRGPAGSGRPLVAALNKIDHAEAMPERAEAFIAQRLPEARLLKISGLAGKGLDELKDLLISLAPEARPGIRRSIIRTRSLFSESPKSSGKKSCAIPGRSCPTPSLSIIPIHANWGTAVSKPPTI